MRKKEKDWRNRARQWQVKGEMAEDADHHSLISEASRFTLELSHENKHCDLPVSFHSSLMFTRLLFDLSYDSASPIGFGG